MVNNFTHLQKINTSKIDVKIAFVGNTSFSLYKFRLGVMRSFIAKGYKVIAIAPKDEYSELFDEENIEFIPIQIDSKGTNIIKDSKLIFKLLKIYKENQINFIFHYTIKPNIYGSIACRILDIPSIAITTGLGFSFNKKNIFNLFIKTLYRFSLQKVLEVWFLNTNDRDIFVKNSIIKKDKAFILNSEGIDSEFYKPIEKESESKRFTFLLLSRLIKEKGIEEYVKAAEILQQKGFDVECQLLGKQEIDSAKSISLETVKDWHNKGIINYLGEFIDIRKYIANCDCVVLPSYYMEGVPRCLMEAMSMERPIITTNNVGCNELIINDVNGLICEPKNIIDLARKMEEMSKTNHLERLKFGINGRKRILDYFDESKIVEQYHFKLSTFYSNSYDKRLDCFIQNSIKRDIPVNRSTAKIGNSF
jgi:glycosyltransferase involved in cell wall biosynthesis